MNKVLNNFIILPVNKILNCHSAFLSILYLPFRRFPDIALRVDHKYLICQIYLSQVHVIEHKKRYDGVTV